MTRRIPITTGLFSLLLALATAPLQAAEPGPAESCRPADGFNAGMAIGVTHHDDQIRNLRVEGGETISTRDLSSEGLAFAADMWFLVFGDFAWLGGAFNVATDSESGLAKLNTGEFLTHGFLAAQGRYNWMKPVVAGLCLFAGGGWGLYTQSFASRYDDKPLRISASGTGSNWFVGLQHPKGMFVNLTYYRYQLDSFDIRLRSASNDRESEIALPIQGSVTGAGVQVQFGFRWY